MAPGLIDELINAASISEAEYYFGQVTLGIKTPNLKA